jgi:hypothetical protein
MTSDARNAQLDGPCALDIGLDGVIYVADWGTESYANSCRIHGGLVPFGVTFGLAGTSARLSSMPPHSESSACAARENRRLLTPKTDRNVVDFVSIASIDFRPLLAYDNFPFLTRTFEHVYGRCTA